MTDAAALSHGDAVIADWIDYNDHMNVAFYVLVFANALDTLRAGFGLGPMRLTQMHTLYGQEVRLGDRLQVETQVLGVTDGRLHLYQEMFHADDGYRAATFESIAAQDTPFPALLKDRLVALIPAEHPEGAGRRVGFRQGR